MDFESATRTGPGPEAEVADDLCTPRLFFGRRSDKAGPEVMSNEPAAVRRRFSRGHRSALRVGLLATGACCLGLIAYGAVTRVGSRRSADPTYHFTLPQAQSAAAVKALPPPNLLKPLSPQQASKENAERPFVARADTAAGRFSLKTDADDRARALTCLAQAVYYEAAGEGADGGRAVAQVVLNRLRHPGFPSTVCGVVYEGSDRPTGCQFSFTCDGSMHRIPIPWLWARSKQIADEALKGRVFAPVGHATHYHADYVLPYWADSLDKSVQIGRHIFYRLRGSLGDARAFSQRYDGIEPPFREPGATVVIPQTPEGQQVTDALINDGGQPAVKDVDKASPVPATPLLIDSRQGALIADAEKMPAPPPARRKSKNECAASEDRRQVIALKADEMRATIETPSC